MSSPPGLDYAFSHRRSLSQPPRLEVGHRCTGPSGQRFRYAWHAALTYCSMSLLVLFDSRRRLRSKVLSIFVPMLNSKASSKSAPHCYSGLGGHQFESSNGSYHPIPVDKKRPTHARAVTIDLGRCCWLTFCRMHEWFRPALKG